MTGEIEGERFVTIVSGLPRSGTSMMMQMLSAGGVPALADNQREADEDNPRGYFEFEPVKQVSEDASWLVGAEGTAVKMVYRLLYDLPSDRRYRVVFMRRNVDEVIASQDVMLQRLGKEGGEIDSTQLAALYERQVQDVLEWLHDQPNFAVLQVDYRDVLSGPAEVVDRVNRFLGGRLDTAAMRQVPDSSLYRQRRATPA